MLHEPEYCHLFQVMSRKENMLSKLQTKKGTWKIVVRITDMWHVNKHNGRLAINMVLMDHTVIVMLFGFIGLPNLVFFTIFICNCSRVQDVWKTGVRVDDKVNVEEGIVEAEEIRKCLDVVMGSGGKGQEFRRNADKWKCLAREAVTEGGSSDSNMRTFLHDVAKFGHDCFM